MSAKPMTREEERKFREDCDTVEFLGARLPEAVHRLLATLDAAERRAEAAEALAARMPGKPWLVSTKEPDLWEFREDNDAGKVTFYFRGTDAEATAWARFFMAVRSALASHAAAVEGREKVPGAPRGPRVSDNEPGRSGAVQPPSEGDGLPAPTGTDLSAEAVALANGTMLGACARVDAKDSPPIIGEPYIVTLRFNQVEYHDFMDALDAYRAARGGGKGDR